ncbi:cell wall-binding repeat-containing protein [Virgibacillus profundi]
MLLLFSLVAPGLVNANDVSGRVLNELNNETESKLSERLQDQFNDEEKITFLIKFKEKADTQKVVKDVREDAKKAELTAQKAEFVQRSAVVSELKATANKAQQNVLEYLEEEVDKGNAEAIKSYFIVNGIAVTATKEVAKSITAFDEVEKILPNETSKLYTSVKKDMPQKPAADSANAEWNIERVKAPQVWDMGIDGTGTVVASIDTGVQWDHPALKEKYRGYDKTTGDVDHDFNWYDATAGEVEPYDDQGHGTHTVGTMLGSETDGPNKIGVAPGAKWIAVKAFTEDGGTDVDLLEAAEWILAPTDEEGNTRIDLAPDVVNNSWGGGPGLDEWYRDVVIAWRNADVLPVFSAGNIGNGNPGGPESIVSPANYPESFAVGATDIVDQVARFSLRGPSPYGEVKPDVTAPGQVIRSSIPGNGYAENSGTSMAGPAVSGVAALVHSINTELSVDELEDILLSTTKPLTDDEYPESPNNGYGYGLVDALNAVAAVDEGVGTIEGKVVQEVKESEIPLSASISILDRGRSVNTDPSDGSYSINYAAGEYTVQAEAYGYQAVQRLVNIEEHETVQADFPLKEIPQRTISGTVTNESGEAIEGAALLLVEDANITPVTTDQNGHYELSAYEGTYKLKVTAHGYYTADIPIKIDEATSDIDVELEPFYSYPGGEIGYDDGTGEGGSWFLEAGSGWGVKMSLAEGEEIAKVTGGKFLFSERGGDKFQVAVYDATGLDGAPGNKLAGPIDATAIKNDEWTTVDLGDEGIFVNDDFYIVYIQTEDRQNTPRLEQDKNGPFTERSWEMYHGYWYQLESNFLTGNKMIRALVDYEVNEPAITSPKHDEITNDSTITVEGTASPTTTIELMNNSEKVGAAEVGDDGKFAITMELTEGKNEITALSTLDGKVTGSSDPVIVTFIAEKPVIENLQPLTDQYVRVGDEVDISFQSNVIGGEANFIVKFPNQSSTQSTSNNMEEVQTGVYKGTWTVPTNVDLQNVTIEVELTDSTGNRVTEEAPGKLFISSEQLDRISGEMRYDTAIEISQEGWETSDTVILSRGLEFADALAGVPLAHKLDAPILLTPNDDLRDNTLEEIERLGAGEVIILGGTGAISENVVEELEEADLDVRRIAGGTRFETAALIASEVSPDGAEEVVVVNGMDFPDALSVASHAAKEGLPILLTKSESLPQVTEAAISDLNAGKTIVVGGTMVVSDEILEQLPDADRLRGADRYETNVEVAKHFGVENKHMYVATGKLYADALTGAVLAAKNDSAILLVSDEVPKGVSEFMTENDANRITIFGGEGAVSNNVADMLEKIIK